MVSELKRAALPAVIGLVGVAAYTLLQITAPQPNPRLDAPRPISVKVEPATRTLTRPTVVAFGEVRPAVRTELVAQVGGKVVATSATSPLMMYSCPSKTLTIGPRWKRS